jgi:hypothetical protein
MGQAGTFPLQTGLYEITASLCEALPCSRIRGLVWGSCVSAKAHWQKYASLAGCQGVGGKKVRKIRQRASFSAKINVSQTVYSSIP